MDMSSLKQELFTGNKETLEGGDVQLSTHL